MTALPPSDDALIAAHKHLAARLHDTLALHAPQATLGRTQALHAIAALHGVPNWQTLRARPYRERLPDTPALEALDQALAQRGVHVPASMLPRLLDGLSPLTCTVLEEDISDTPAKTQVMRSLLLHGLITPDCLRHLLMAEFERVRLRTGFRHHPHPTSVYIGAYPSETHHQGGAGQQAGMVQWPHADSQARKTPKVIVNEALIRSVQEPEILSFGLSEQTRQTIFRDHGRVTNRARIAADKAHPLNDDGNREAMRVNAEYKHARLMEWDRLLAEQHGLTHEQFRELIGEGMVRSWAMTSLQDTATETIA